MNRKLEPQIAASARKPGSQLRSADLSGVASGVTPDTLPQGHDGVARFPATVSTTTATTYSGGALTSRGGAPDGDADAFRPTRRSRRDLDHPARGAVPPAAAAARCASLRHAAVELFALGTSGVYDTVARAVSGERLRADAPFPIDFDPAELLP
ncbi:hypothetical protein [Micromonospora carbonacea]|uniref:hypothetical protein n=1 Tax=Micromonospora carbonacea TaxID=47853 RepID=UPI003D9EA734